MNGHALSAIMIVLILATVFLDATLLLGLRVVAILIPLVNKECH